MDSTQRPDQKPATAARIYDYFIGGTHNFPADRDAAQEIIKRVPLIPAIARANRAFLGRAVRYAANAGVRQFLDIGSGIPTEGNVHEIAQDIAADAHVVYVDIDPVAVSEGLEILEGNDGATAIRGSVTDIDAILAHPEVVRLIDFSQPVAFLLCAVLHFVTDDEAAHGAVARLRKVACPGSYLILSHGTPDEDQAAQTDRQDDENAVQDVYTRQTTTPFRLRDRREVTAIFNGFELVEPGLVWAPSWRPDAGDAAEFHDEPHLSSMLSGVGVC